MAKEISYEDVIKTEMVHGVIEERGRMVTLGQIPHNYLDENHLLQVIRDMDRRITDLERKLEHSVRT